MADDTKELGAAGGLGAKISEAASDVGTRAQRFAEQAGSGASDVLRSGREQAESLGEYVDDFVQDRPLAALLAAGGVGFLLGMLINRR